MRLDEEKEVTWQLVRWREENGNRERASQWVQSVGQQDWASTRPNYTTSAANPQLGFIRPPGCSNTI
jgi:hypothetical protein